MVQCDFSKIHEKALSQISFETKINVVSSESFFIGSKSKSKKICQMALSQEEDFDPQLFLKSFSKIDHLYLMEKYSKMMQYLPWFLTFQLEDFIVYYEGL